MRERERNASYFYYFFSYAFIVFFFALSFVIDNNIVVTAAINANSNTKNWKVYSCCCAVSCIRMALGHFLFSSSPSSNSSLLAFFNLISLALRSIDVVVAPMIIIITRPVHLRMHEFSVRARTQMYREVSVNVENQNTRRRYITSPCNTVCDVCAEVFFLSFPAINVFCFYLFVLFASWVPSSRQDDALQ